MTHLERFSCWCVSFLLTANFISKAEKPTKNTDEKWIQSFEGGSAGRMGNRSPGSGLSSNHTDQEIVGEPLKKKVGEKNVYGTIESEKF